MAASSLGPWLDELEPVQRSGLGERVYQQLQERILSGKIGAGQHLVEQALADQLAVSRISLREAIRRLADDGLVEIIPNRGAYTRRFAVEDIAEIFSLRAALEGMAGELAATRAQPADLAPLQAVVDELGRLELSDDRLRGAEVDTEFHRALMELSGQRRAFQIWRSMSAQITMVVYTVSNYYPRYDGLAARHQRIVDLLQAGQAREAGEYLREHILEGGQHLLQAMVQGEPS
jgi:DNA-binding GntR family transcriptional regulator